MRTYAIARFRTPVEGNWRGAGHRRRTGCRCGEGRRRTDPTPRSVPFISSASPGVEASARTYLELEARASATPGIEFVALRYGFFYGPGTWYMREGDIGDQVRQQQVPIIGEGQGVYSFVHSTAALECPPGAYNIVDGNPSPQHLADGVRACCRSTCATSRQRRRGASGVRPRRGTTLVDQCCKRSLSDESSQKIWRSHHRHRPGRDVFSRPCGNSVISLLRVTRRRASIQITGRPSCLSSVHSHVAVGPVSRPIRTAPGAFNLTNTAIASGSESTTPSRTTDPTWFTTQIDVCFNDTSSPT